MEAAANEKRTGPPAGGKYLIFGLAGEEYGVEILRVREIIGMTAVTPVPQTPPFVRGVINLRGRVIPLIDLRRKLGLPVAPYSDQTCIVIVEVETLLGVIVDAVLDVVDLPADRIERPPPLGPAVCSNCVGGIGRVQDDVKILLDLERVLSAEEMDEVTGVAAGA